MLRKKMGKTQTTFAVEVMKTAISTIARWETGDPPHGSALLRLAKIADESGTAAYRDGTQDGFPFIQLALTFQRLYLEEVIRDLGRTTPLLHINPQNGKFYLVMEGEGEAQFQLAEKFLNAVKETQQ